MAPPIRTDSKDFAPKNEGFRKKNLQCRPIPSLVCCTLSSRHSEAVGHLLLSEWPQLTQLHYPWNREEIEFCAIHGDIHAVHNERFLMARSDGRVKKSYSAHRNSVNQ